MTNPLTHLMSPYYTERLPNHNLLYTMDHTFGYCSQKLIRTCVKSYAQHTVPKSEADILNSLKLPHYLQGNGRILMPDGDPRTGMFPQLQPTAGHTTCTVKGVLAINIYDQ